MEEQLAAGLGKREIAEFVEDDEVEPGQVIGEAALPAGTGFTFQPINEVDDGVKAAPRAATPRRGVPRCPHPRPGPLAGQPRRHAERSGPERRGADRGRRSSPPLPRPCIGVLEWIGEVLYEADERVRRGLLALSLSSVPSSSAPISRE
jgi:hypothetical protein